MQYNPGIFQLGYKRMKRMLDIIEQQKKATPGGVVFYGDSLTQFNPTDEFYGDLSTVYNCGIAGAVTEELIWMVDEAVIKYQPRVVVLMAGTNDLDNGVDGSPKTAAANMKTLVDLILSNSSDIQILLYSPLPCIEALEGYQKGAGTRSNELLRLLYKCLQDDIRDRRVVWLDVYPAFVDEQGKTRSEYYCDGLHLNHEGYSVLNSLVRCTLEELL